MRLIYVSKINFIDKNEKFNSVHIIFSHWKNTESARIFQEKAKTCEGAKLVYDDPWHWVVLEYRQKKYEKLEERENDTFYSVVENQLNNSVLNLNANQIVNVLIAYEPVWAIGTGRTATAKQAGEIHQFIYECLIKKYGVETAEQVSILYGGSCNPKNAQELFSNKHINGGLIGGASLIAEDFYSILNS